VGVLILWTPWAVWPVPFLFRVPFSYVSFLPTVASHKREREEIKTDRRAGVRARAQQLMQRRSYSTKSNHDHVPSCEQRCIPIHETFGWMDPAYSTLVLFGVSPPLCPKTIAGRGTVRKKVKIFPNSNGLFPGPSSHHLRVAPVVQNGRSVGKRNVLFQGNNE
jgi:hypothetical protein